MKFELDEEQITKYKVWRKEQDNLALNLQQDDLAKRKLDPNYKPEFADRIISDGCIYMGAIGCSPTISFTNSSIGTFITARHPITGNTLDLTGDL